MAKSLRPRMRIPIGNSPEPMQRMPRPEMPGMKKGGKCMSKGGAVTRGDGCVTKGHTKGKMV